MAGTMSDEQQLLNIQTLADQVRNIVQIGTIVEADFDNAKCKVEFSENFTSDWIPWGETHASETRTWTPPKVGAQVVVLSAGGNLKRGVIISQINQAAYPQLSTDGDLQKIEFANGTTIEIHENNNTMNVNCSGVLTINTSTSINASAPLINITIPSGDVTIDGVSLVNHTHVKSSGTSVLPPTKV